MIDATVLSFEFCIHLDHSCNKYCDLIGQEEDVFLINTHKNLIHNS